MGARCLLTLRDNEEIMHSGAHRSFTSQNQSADANCYSRYQTLFVCFVPFPHALIPCGILYHSSRTMTFF
jgi:hypothetical protein